jgi:hypothetical protein
MHYILYELGGDSFYSRNVVRFRAKECEKVPLQMAASMDGVCFDLSSPNRRFIR